MSGIYLAKRRREEIRTMNTDFNPPLQKYAPEGEPLHAIIEEYADSQDAWLEFFLPGCGKDAFYFIMFAILDLLSFF